MVLIEHGGAGGKIAGPVARAVIEGWWTQVKGKSRGTVDAVQAPVGDDHDAAPLAQAVGPVVPAGPVAPAAAAVGGAR